MIEGTGVHMANHSTGWFALINVINFPVTNDDDFEFICSNDRFKIDNFNQLYNYATMFVPIVSYNSKIAIYKIFSGII